MKRIYGEYMFLAINTAILIIGSMSVLSWIGTWDKMLLVGLLLIAIPGAASLRIGILREEGLWRLDKLREKQKQIKKEGSA